MASSEKNLSDLSLSQKPTKLFKLLCLGLVLLGLLVRYYHFDAPLADDHAWKQTNQASLAYHLFESDFDYAELKLFSLPFNSDSPSFYHEEIPLYISIVASLYKLAGVHESLGRLISIHFSLLSIIWFWGLLKKHFSERVCFYAMIFYIFSPLHLFYARAFMPDMAMISTAIGGLYYFDEWMLSGKRKNLFLSAILIAASVSFKYFGILVLVPIALLMLKKYSWKALIKPEIFLLTTASVLPLVYWMAYVSYVLGMDLSGHGVFQSMSSSFVWGDLLNLEFYETVFWTRLTERVILHVGFICVIVAMLSGALRVQPLLFFWLLQPVAHALLFQSQSYLHEYYQLDFVAPLAALAGFGLSQIEFVFVDRGWKKAWIAVFILLISYFGYQSFVKTTNMHRIDRSSVKVAEKVKELTSPQDRILFLTSTLEEELFFYYARRYGWRFTKDSLRALNIEKKIEKYKRMGATHLILLIKDEDMIFFNELNDVLTDKELIYQDRNLPTKPEKIEMNLKRNESVIKGSLFQVYRLR